MLPNGLQHFLIPAFMFRMGNDSVSKRPVCKQTFPFTHYMCKRECAKVRILNRERGKVNCNYDVAVEAATK